MRGHSTERGQLVGNKQFLIRALVLLNVILLGVLLGRMDDTSNQALAQTHGGGGAYAVGSALYEVSADAVWVLNARNGDLAVLLANQQSGQMRFLGKRNVEDDAR